MLLGTQEAGVQFRHVLAQDPRAFPPLEDEVLDAQVREQDVGVDRL
jgi:hypothetical protein